MIDNGCDVCEDDEAVLKRYMAAAEQGEADAQLLLGELYQSGDGVPQSDENALRWFRLAA